MKLRLSTIMMRYIMVKSKSEKIGYKIDNESCKYQ